MDQGVKDAVELYLQRKKERRLNRAIDKYIKRRAARLAARRITLSGLASLDGGPGSRNFGHEGRPGEKGGSLPSSSSLNDSLKDAYEKEGTLGLSKACRKALQDSPIGTKIVTKRATYEKVGDNKYEYEYVPGKKSTVSENYIINGIGSGEGVDVPIFENISSEDVAQAKIESGELKPSETEISTEAKELSKKLGDSKGGTIATGKDGSVWEKRDEGYWVSRTTGEIVDADSIAADGGSPLQYDGSLELKHGSRLSKELMDHKMSEFARHQLEQEGKVSITSKEMEEIVNSISLYGVGGECQLILATQDPDHYQKLLKLANLSEEQTASYAHEAQNVERYIALSDKVQEPLYRGIGFNTSVDDPEVVEKTLSSLKVGGIIDMGHIASWSTHDGTARKYSEGVLDAELLEGDNYAVVYSLSRNKSAASLSGINPEGECLSPSSARYRVTSVSHSYDERLDITRYHVELEEV